MLKKLIYAGGLAYLARRFLGGRRTTAPLGAGGSRWGRRGW